MDQWAGECSPNDIGVLNFRDVGGYAVSATNAVEVGLLYRSAAPVGIDKGTARTLAGRISTRIDLRSTLEKMLDPVAELPGVMTASVDVMKDAPASLLFFESSGMYESFVGNGSVRAALGDALKLIARSRGGVLIHCSKGRDRTGWLVAVLLRILGVSEELVEFDYMASNAFLGGEDRCRREDLRKTFRVVNREFGTVDGYVHNGLGLDRSDVSSLRSRFVVELEDWFRPAVVGSGV